MKQPQIACTSKWHTKTHSSDTFVRFPKWNQQQPQPNNRKKPNNHQSNAWATLILFLMFQCVLINNFFVFVFDTPTILWIGIVFPLIWFLRLSPFLSFEAWSFFLHIRFVGILFSRTMCDKRKASVLQTQNKYLF